MKRDSFKVDFYLLRDNKEPEVICHRYVTRYKEWIKLLEYCKNNEIPLCPHAFARDEIADEIYKQGDFFVDDFSVVFGPDTTFPGIDVYLK